MTELEFVCGMVISMGAKICGEPLDFDTHVRPLINRFRAIDEDGSGTLTRDDLLFMVRRDN